MLFQSEPRVSAYPLQGAENVISPACPMNRPAAITWLLRPSLQSKRVVVGRRNDDDDDDDDDDHRYARCPDTMIPELCGSDDSQLGLAH